MKKNNILLILLGGLLGFAFTVFIYNFKIVLNLITALYENQVLIHIGVTGFYYWLFIFLTRRLQISKIAAVFFTVITPVLIDASVLITNPERIPVRFPFSSIFPLLGACLGYLKLYGKRAVFAIACGFTVCLLIVTSVYILRALFFYSIGKNAPKLPGNILEETFYAIDERPVLLKDTNTTRNTIIECFFYGCLPCEQKKDALMRLRDATQQRQLGIIFICDGAITPFKKFQDYASDNKTDGITFLYDKDSVLRKKMQLNRYPFEVQLRDEKIVQTMCGFDKHVVDSYLTKKIAIIKSFPNK